MMVMNQVLTNVSYISICDFILQTRIDVVEGDQVGNGPWLDDEDNFEAISDVRHIIG